MKLKDAAELFGIEKKAPKKDVQKAYKSYMLKHHPDKNPKRMEEAKEEAQKGLEAFGAFKRGCQDVRLCDLHLDPT